MTVDGDDDLLGSSDVLRTVLDGALAAVVVMDARGRIRGWGPRAVRTFGWSRSEAIGADLAELIVPPELRERHRSGIARYLATGEQHVLGRVVEMEGLVRSGDRIPVEIRINPPFEHRGETLFIAFIIDIGDRRRSEQRQRELFEEAQRANDALRDYSSLMVHELRAPLSVIAGYTSILREEWSNAPAHVRSGLAELAVQAEKANGLVDRLLMVARVDAGALDPRLEIVDAVAAIEGVVARTRARVALLGARVTVDITSGRRQVQADVEWTGVILDNLVNNALVHGGTAPEIEIKLGGSGSISIWVTDTGPGIPEASRHRLFERFSRTEGRAASGSGLGLYLSRRLARLQGGDIVLEEGDGPGACFRLDLVPAPGRGHVPSFEAQCR